MNRSPAFQFYADDFLAGTYDMTQAEVGSYIRLLCEQWNRGSIRLEPEFIQRKAGGTVSEYVLSKFDVGSDGLGRNKRLEEVRANRALFIESQRLKGIKSAEKRSNPGSTPVQPRLDSGCLSVPTQLNSPTPTPTPTPSSKSHSPSAGKEASNANPEHSAFIKGWTENFKTAFGFDYVWSGRDAKAVQSLLRNGILRIDLLEIAKDAWKRGQDDIFATNSKKASTIFGFHDFFTQIRVELKTKATHGNKITQPNPRNVGVCRAGPSYGDAARLKLQRQSERMERQVAEAANPESPQVAGT